jgi:hypothetical protein
MASISDKYLHCYEGLDELNRMDLDNVFEGQCKVIFDDLGLEKDQLYRYATYHKVTMEYQKKIRGNTNYIVLRKISSTRDLNSC